MNGLQFAIFSLSTLLVIASFAFWLISRGGE
jgi:hypothetical protein